LVHSRQYTCDNKKNTFISVSLDLSPTFPVNFMMKFKKKVARALMG
jgi:hypothetical protein